MSRHGIAWRGSDMGADESAQSASTTNGCPAGWGVAMTGSNQRISLSRGWFGSPEGSGVWGMTVGVPV
jgi:hypothetical protein